MGAAAGAGGMAGAAGAMSGAAGATDGAAAGGGAVEPGGMQCPNEVCAPLPESMMGAAAGFSVKLCCSAEGDCGTSLNGADCVKTPDSFAGCPPLMAMGFTIPSCCTMDGKCGIDGSAFMMGCTSLEMVASQAGGFIDVPPPAPCTPMP